MPWAFHFVSESQDSGSSLIGYSVYPMGITDHSQDTTSSGARFCRAPFFCRTVSQTTLVLKQWAVSPLALTVQSTLTLRAMVGRPNQTPVIRVAARDNTQANTGIFCRTFRIFCS